MMLTEKCPECKGKRAGEMIAAALSGSPCICDRCEDKGWIELQECDRCGEVAEWARDDDVPFCTNCKEEDTTEMQWWPIQ